MEERTRNRAVGAAVLLLAAVIVLPLVLESSPPSERLEDAASEPAPADPPAPAPDRIRITTLEGKEEPPPPPPPKPARAAEAPARPAGASAGGSGPAADPKPDGEAAPAAGWAVQIGSFADPGNAERLRAQVASRGYRVLTQQIAGEEGKGRVRVLVGPDRTRAAAAAWRSRLEREDSIRGFLVRYPG